MTPASAMDINKANKEYAIICVKTKDEKVKRLSCAGKMQRKKERAKKANDVEGRCWNETGMSISKEGNDSLDSNDEDKDAEDNDADDDVWK